MSERKEQEETHTEKMELYIQAGFFIITIAWQVTDIHAVVTFIYLYALFYSFH